MELLSIRNRSEFAEGESARSRTTILEEAMSAMLGLGLSVILTVALLGWLMAQDH